MTMANERTYIDWIGHQAIDTSGQKVGKISQVYLDDVSGTPEWISIKTGMLGNASSFVPLQGTRLEGDTLILPYDKGKVKGAPSVDEDKDGHLGEDEERELYQYYGVNWDRSTGGGTLSFESTRTQGHDTSGPPTDDAMTRSEEEVSVGVATREAGKARLRKHVVTEDVNTTVPVSHEEAHLERQPITQANAGKAMAGPDISEEEHEIVLHEEQPIVQKNVVPKERVRLSSQPVNSQAEVSETVRKERIDAEDVGLTDSQGKGRQ